DVGARQGIALRRRRRDEGADGGRSDHVIQIARHSHRGRGDRRRFISKSERTERGEGILNMKNQKAKSVSGLLAIVLLMTPTLLPQNNQQSAIRNPQSRNPQSEARVGVNPSKRVTLTLRDAMTMALENNRDIEVERLNVQMNEFDLRGAQGFYDPNLA